MEVDKIIEIIKRVVKYIFWITVGSILIYWLISDPGRYALIKEKVSGITAPFVFGSVLAFILNVPMRTIENLLAKIPKLRGRRVIAVLLTFIAGLLVIALVFLLLLPQLSDTLKRLIPSLVSFFVSIGNEINQFMQNNPELMNWLAENTNLNTLLGNYLVEILRKYFDCG